MGSNLSVPDVREVNREVDRIWRQGEVRDVTSNYEKVGSHFNDWRMPVSKYARNEFYLAERLKENDYIGEYEVSTQLWQKSCGVVDEITQLFQKTLNIVTSRKYPCLIFEDFVKQGSSREGLKIRYPDEFDMILPFSIDGVSVEAVPALDNGGEPIPALVKLRVSNDSHRAKVMYEDHYHTLRREEIFETRGSDVFLNARYLQTRVVLSIMDTAIAEIKKAIAEEMPHESCSFTLCKASVYPPTYRFKIIMNSDADFDELSHIRNTFRRLQDDRVQSRDYLCAQSSSQEWNQERKIIEFDIVPGFLLQTDLVPDPDSWIPMTCDRYAVMKWIHKERYADDYPSPDLLWRESTCGYEKHIIDISCRNERYLYILTACRVLKAYIDGSSGCSQLSSLLSSYHLKNIAIHCILLQINVSSVKEALGYFMIFLEIGLEKEFLPHYFYGNSNIADMFSMLSPKIGSKRLNLLKHIPGDHFVQARLSLGRMQADLRPLYAESFEHCNPKKIDSFRELCSVYDESGKCILM